MEATVKDSWGKVKAAIREAVSVVEDFRMQMVGGPMAAFDLWEAAVLPIRQLKHWITSKTIL